MDGTQTLVQLKPLPCGLLLQSQLQMPAKHVLVPSVWKWHMFVLHQQQLTGMSREKGLKRLREKGATGPYLLFCN